jgi:hypothetical protein
VRDYAKKLRPDRLHRRLIKDCSYAFQMIDLNIVRDRSLQISPVGQCKLLICHKGHPISVICRYTLRVSEKF